jgi:FKBP-type peptidyl-prolyl cis-trans isomerase FkpA
MQPTQTSIAVALALAVIAFFFIFNGVSIFSTSIPDSGSSDLTTQTETNSNQPMPNDPTAVKELQVTDEVIGTGAVAQPGDTVTVDYVGALTDGTVFDASKKHGTDGFTFKLGAGNVIRGWDLGVAGMKEGGKRKLVIPASLGYGSQGYPGVIPTNATLNFEVELLKVQKN